MPESVVNFDKYARFYSLINQGKDYKGEVEYLCQLIGQYKHDAKTVLELGTGAGGHAPFLIEKGFEVTGIERSIRMAIEAWAKGLKVEVGDISAVRLSRKFDIVVALFHVISYLNKEKEMERTFRLTHEHLVAGGIFIFDIWYKPAVLFLKPEKREKIVEFGRYRIKRIANPVMHLADNLVDVNYEFELYNDNTSVEKWDEKHSLKYFDKGEISDLAKKTGFEILEAKEFLSSAKPSKYTWGVCFVLKKT
jgi:hypothetical protein